MTHTPSTFTTLPDGHLLAEVGRLAATEREATAQLIAALMEIDTRRLYLGQGCSSLFTYCTQALHLSEHAAYGRIEAARAARRFPVILTLLAEGAVTLTTVGLLATHLTPDNCAELLTAARHTSKRDVEHMIASPPSRRPSASCPHGHRHRRAFLICSSRVRCRRPPQDPRAQQAGKSPRRPHQWPTSDLRRHRWSCRSPRSATRCSSPFCARHMTSWPAR